jgi:integrase
MPTPRLAANADGTWYAYWSENRRSKRKSMGTASLAEAEARFAQWLLIRNAVPVAERAFTVADCWTVYLDRHVQPNVAAKATAGYAWKALEPHFGAMLAAGVDQDAVDAYVAARSRKVKAPTIRRELAALVAALNFCARARVKMLDPTLRFKFDLPAVSEPRDRWLTTGEMQALLRAAGRLRRGDRLSRGERFLWLALGTAGRKEALLDLTWDRVDFETGVIHLDVPGRRKTNKRRASVPMSAELRGTLERAHRERIGPLVLDNKAEVWAAVQLIAIEAGLGGGQGKPKDGARPKATGISPHVLRHTAATHMARRGVPLFHIAKVLGDTIATVEKTYAKHCPDDLREAVGIVSRGLEIAA